MTESILLQTKFLVPRLTTGLLPRTHLINQVCASLDQRVVVLTAPPGYGKTTLMAGVTNSLERPVLWYQLDNGDNDPMTFIAYLVEGLCRILPALGARVRRLLSDSDEYQPERALVVLLNELVENPDQTWVLVLDDYHYINNPAVHAITSMLIENQLPSMSVILATRGTPPLPLARWRARGWLAEIRAEHLRFSRQEAIELLHQYMPDLPEDIAASLVEKTEGWGAGLQLAMKLLVEQPSEDLDMNAFVARLSGAHPYIFSYLMEEAFERQPGYLQDFMLCSSVLTQMNAAICQEVLKIDDPQLMLDQLMSEGVFLISLDEQREWYRYHQLFREFLLDKLTRQSREQLRALQHAAAAYYETRGESETALQYYLLAGDRDRAATVMTSIAADYLNQGRADVLNRYFNQLGLPTLKLHPNLLLMHGRALRQLGLLNEAISKLKQARAAAGPIQAMDAACLALTELAGIARGQGDYVQAHQYATAAIQLGLEVEPATRALQLMELARCQGLLEGMTQGRALAEQAIAEMQRADDTISVYQQARLLRSLGQICWWQGDVRAAVGYCQAALSRLPNKESPLAAHVMITLATPCLYRHQHDTALEYAEQALAICQRLQLRELLSRSYAVLGNILTRVGQLTHAEGCLRQAIDLAGDLGSIGYARVMAEGYLAYNLMTQGRHDEARLIVEAALWPHEEQPIVYETYVCRSILADSYLTDHRLAQAARIFEELRILGEHRQYRIPLAMVYFGLAYIRLTEGKRAEGLALAQQSLNLLEPTQTWELYVDQGARALVVCDALAEAFPENRFVDQVRHAVQHTSRPPAVNVLPDIIPRIRVRMLGSFRVSCDKQEIDPKSWGSVKARDMLAYFATFRHESIPFDRIMEALWPDKTGQGKNAFHTTLYRLRQALRREGEATKFVLVETGDYRLDVARFEVDVDVFDNHLSQIQEVPVSMAIRRYQAALELYKGAYLDNLYYDWLLPERQRLTDAYLGALRGLATLHANSGAYADAEALVLKAIQINPLAEDLHCELIRYLHAQGNRQGMIKQYDSLKQLLQDELGVAPLPTTQALFQKLMAHTD